MNSDRERPGGKVPLPGWQEPGTAPPPPPPEAAAARADGIRHLRRMSAWSAAALIVGTGAATAALAHNYAPATQSAGTQAVSPAGGAAAAQHGGGPAVTHSVATTSGSGVTVTTTKTAGGKTIVTRVHHGGTYHDN
jgi:hypothetical protein